jgi:hypothetical protein
LTTDVKNLANNQGQENSGAVDSKELDAAKKQI